MKSNKIITNNIKSKFNNTIGNKDISNIYDGTITTSIKELGEEYIAHSGGGEISDEDMNIADKVNAIYEYMKGNKEGFNIIIDAVNTAAGSTLLNDESTPQDIADIITSLGTIDVDGLQPWVFTSNNTFTVPLNGNYKIILNSTNGQSSSCQGYDHYRGTYSSSSDYTSAGGNGQTFTGICKLVKGQILNITSISGTSSGGWSSLCDGHARDNNYSTRVCGGNGGTGVSISINNEVLVSAAGGNGASISFSCNGRGYSSSGGKGGGSNACNNLSSATWLSSSNTSVSNRSLKVSIQYIGLKTS